MNYLAGPSRKCFGIFLAAVLSLLFPAVILGSRTFFYRDFGVLAYPSLFFARQSFWAGQVPLWNPYSNCGAPFLAQWGTMFFYPGALLYYLLPVPWSVNLFCLGHLWWAGMGMYQLMKSWTANPLAASVAGTAYVLNGICLATLMWPNYTVAIAWLPWILWSLERSWTSPWPYGWIALAAAVCQLLAGVPELVILTWILAAVIAAVAIARRQAPVRQLLLATAAVILGSAFISALQLLPFFDLLHHSQRGLQFATSKWAMAPWGWANFILPLFHTFQTPQGAFFQSGQEFLSSTYPSVIVLALAFPAVRTVHSPKACALAGLALLSCWMALGDHSLLYRLLKNFVPLLGLARYPIKFLFVTSTVLPILAGFSAEALSHADSRVRASALRNILISAVILWLAIAALMAYSHRWPFPFEQFDKLLRNGIARAVFLAFGLAAAAAIVRNAGRPRITLAAQWTLLALLVLDVVTHLPSQNPTLPSSVLSPNFWPQAVGAPGPQLGQGRLMISPYAEKHLLLSGVPDLYNDFIGKRLTAWSHLNLLDQLPKVNGSSTLQLRPQRIVQELLYSSTNTELPQLEKFLSVAYKTAPGQIVEWKPQPSSLPWITLGQQPIFLPPAKILTAITNSQFNPQTTVFLEEQARGLVPSSPASGKILSQEFGLSKIHCQIKLSNDGLVVIAQSFYHPWHAYVDEAPARLWVANYAFQAVGLPKGSHSLELRYEDPWWRLGAAISLAGLLIAIASFAAARRRVRALRPTRPR